MVDKVVFTTQAGQIRASGVTTKMGNGSSKTYFARREIIISGGAYCSPAVLLRSGIGPSDELNKHGIPCKVNSPGVGRNLMDHLVRLNTRA
jgi:choline dehydrogenase-like flavoprotein